MKKYLPEGKIFNSPENRYYLQSERTMAEAMAQGLILEGHAVLCDSEHNIIVELPFGKGIIPRSEGAIGIQEGKTKDSEAQRKQRTAKLSLRNLLTSLTMKYS